MKFIPLIFAGLRRNRARSTLTLLSGMVAFLLFGLLQGADTFFAQFVSNQHLDVLVISNPAYLPMPFAYLRQIAALSGVRDISYGNETNGYFKDPKNGLGFLAYDPSLFQVDQGPIKASPEDRRALAQTPNGALITRGLAQRTGWKRGDQVSVHVQSLPQKSGSMDWQLRIVGLVELEGGLGSADSVVLTNYDYIDKGRAIGAGTVTQFLARIANPARAGAISEAIDNLFVNSPVQTRTMSARDLAQSLLARIGNIDFFLDSILAAVFFTLLLLVGNALMQSFRERIPEFAILKTLGFTDGQVAVLVMGEAVFLCLGAAVLGLALAWFGVPALARVLGGLLPHPPPIVVLEGLIAAALIGIVCGLIPGWKARRLTVIQALVRR